PPRHAPRDSCLPFLVSHPFPVTPLGTVVVPSLYLIPPPVTPLGTAVFPSLYLIPSRHAPWDSCLPFFVSHPPPSRPLGQLSFLPCISSPLVTPLGTTVFPFLYLIPPVTPLGTVVFPSLYLIPSRHAPWDSCLPFLVSHPPLSRP
ncbi:predicted protein, partial [Nematostella vectensis]